VIRRAVLAAGLVTVLAAGCGSQAAPAALPSIAIRTAPLATSLVTAQGAWAVAVMGGSAAAADNFWELFVRPPGASKWSLVTPPGVASNGGLIASGATGGTSLLVGLRPSQQLAFSPLATAATPGRTGHLGCWTRT
jgi:hypothetical protein